MGVGKRVKVEILYDTYAGDKLGFSFPPPQLFFENFHHCR